MFLSLVMFSLAAIEKAVPHAIIVSDDTNTLQLPQLQGQLHNSYIQRHGQQMDTTTGRLKKNQL